MGMGFHKSPEIANLFLSDHKKNWIKDCPSEFKPLFTADTWMPILFYLVMNLIFVCFRIPK